MYRKKVVINKPKGVKLCPVGKAVYVYHVLESKYDSSRKYNTEKRVCIGKMVEGSTTQMIPNDSFELYYPELIADSAELPQPKQYSQTLHAGAVAVQRQIAQNIGLMDILVNIYGDRMAREIMSVVSFVLTEESAVFQHYPDFMRNHLPAEKGIRSDSYISSKLLHQAISDERIIEMLRQWNKLNVTEEKVYIGCDSTNFNTEAENMSLAEMGAAKDDPTEPQINLAVAVSQKDTTPLYYDLFPGSIIDLSECEQLIDQMHTFGYRNVGLLFDRGYFSESNVRELDSLGYDFMMMLRENQVFVRELIKEHAASIKDHSNTYLGGMEVYGLTVSRQLYGKERFFHIYYDEVKASYIKRRFLNSLSALRSDLDDLVGTPLRKNMNLGKFRTWFHLNIDKNTRILKSYETNESKISDIMLRSGFFVIMTSEKMETECALETYRGRDNIEKFFRGIKSGMDFDSPGVHDDRSLAAKIHLMFIAGIIRNRFVLAGQAIRKATGNKKAFTVPAMIDQLEQIECTAYDNGIYQRRYAFTAKQKLIMEHLGIDPSVIDSDISTFNSLHPLT